MTFCDYREVFFMYQSEGTGRERKGEISQRRKQNEIIIITILAVIMTAVMFANILENPKISDQSANEKEKMLVMKYDIETKTFSEYGTIKLDEYTGRAEVQVNAFLKNVVQPVLDDNKEILGMTAEINV